ncbi:MAG: zinc ribbon domain-containing protein [Methanobacteriota archaeon]|nr:MAG: zinc ribbon domain-containing protein [Euryarchaeota archaeon]
MSLEEEEAACPICGALVSLEVTICPNCGAEFEEEEVVEEVVFEEEELAECPVCGKMISLTISTCPNCGAEFEEEEVEEIIEVEERQVPERAKAKAIEPFDIAFGIPTSILDFRVIGIALIVLGILGAQVAALIDWYWTWVPPIEDNFALFVMLPIIVLIVGLLIFMFVKKAATGGKKIPGRAPGVSLSIFLFGIILLIVMLMWNPINSALESSKVGVAGGFLVVFVIGVLLVFVGMRSTSAERSPA